MARPTSGPQWPLAVQAIRCATTAPRLRPSTRGARATSAPSAPATSRIRPVHSTLACPRSERNAPTLGAGALHGYCLCYEWLLVAALGRLAAALVAAFAATRLLLGTRILRSLWSLHHIPPVGVARP